MGLLDVLNGMQNDPRGQSMAGAAGGRMSPITMAILGLLAYRAVKGGIGGSQGAGVAPAGSSTQGGIGGGIGDLLKSGLGGLLAGGAAGGVLSGGLGDLVKQFQQGGLAGAVNSWVGHGPNQQVAPNDLAKALGSDQIHALMSQTGMPREELLSGLSQQLPQAVDELTPDGRLPTEQEMTQRIR